MAKDGDDYSDLANLPSSIAVLQKYVPHPYQSLNSDGEILTVNDAWLDILGYDRNTVEGRPFGEFLANDSVDVFESRFPEFKSTGGISKVEFEMERADGELIIVGYDGTVEYDDDGSFVRTHCQFQEITERKEWEREMQRLKDRFQLAVEGANIGIWDWDMQTDEVDRDELLTEMLGYTPEQMGDHIEDWERVVHPEGKNRHNEELAEHIENRTSNYQCDYRLKTAFGDWKWVRTIGKVVEWDDDGEPIRAVGIHIDIDERKEREQELRRQKERLDEFASMVSHDLRNPLNVAQGRISLAREECDIDHLDAAADGIQRSLELIEDLLALARAGQDVSEMEPVDLADLVDDCWDTIETADATVVADLESTIRADQTRLRQLIENLFRNAVENGSEDVTVRIGSLPEGFYIEDDGPGISEDEREDVWEAGYTGTEEGTGFGLFIVNQIVEAHDWNIHISEGSDGGARFELTGVEVVAE